MSLGGQSNEGVPRIIKLAVSLTETSDILMRILEGPSSCDENDISSCGGLNRIIPKNYCLFSQQTHLFYLTELFSKRKDTKNELQINISLNRRLSEHSYFPAQDPLLLLTKESCCSTMSRTISSFDRQLIFKTSSALLTSTFQPPSNGSCNFHPKPGY